MREDWKEVRFGDVVQFPPKVKLEKGEEYPFIPMENIDGGIKYVSSSEMKNVSGGGAKFEDGDTLFARITPSLENGKIAQAKNLKGKPGFGSTEFFVFRGIKDITDTDFIYYYSKTQWFRQNAVNSMVGASGRQRADAGFVKNYRFNLPPLATQQKIAEILSAYDDLIENNLRRIQILEEMAQQTYEEWFVRMRYPGYENDTINLETGLPEGWEKKELKNIVKLISGYAFKSKDFQDDPNDFIAVRMGNFKIGGGLKFDKNKYVKEESLHKIKKKFKLKPYDLLMVLSDVTREGTIIGNVGFVPSDNKNYYLNQRVSKLEVSDEMKFYLFDVLNSLEFKNHCITRANSVTVLNLKNEDIYKYEITIPSQNILNSWLEFSKSIRNSIFNINQRNHRLRESRDLLLPRLMMGLADAEEILG